ncbi:MAG: manganese efflux pump MntP family protein [Oscillospiraceae bacterium]|nr:manganese efflux pump MntP family protein [Oscillospiraceae bacterium]
MNWNFMFFFNSVLLGVGLAMDAFSVSLANGLNEPDMKRSKICGIAGTFGFFQALMPVIGWICVHTVVQYFSAFEKLIPWIALVLLLFIGGKMLIEGIKNEEEESEKSGVGFGALMVQGIATSIDALSVGFTISDYNLPMALVCAAVIAVVTFIISIAGLFIGRKFGTKLSNKAAILGGSILVFIGLEIWIKGIFTKF